MMESFHLTPLSPLSTGLSQRVWVATYAPGVSEGIAQDYDRPELYFGEAFARVQLAPTIEVVEGRISANDFDRLNQWINLNLDCLLSHWRGEIDSVELARILVPLS